MRNGRGIYFVREIMIFNNRMVDNENGDFNNYKSARLAIPHYLILN